MNTYLVVGTIEVRFEIEIEAENEEQAEEKIENKLSNRFDTEQYDLLETDIDEIILQSQS